MKLKEEYNSIIGLINKIVSCENAKERKLFGKLLISRITTYEKRINNIEEEIDKIANKATKNFQDNQRERDFEIINAVMDLLHEIQTHRR